MLGVENTAAKEIQNSCPHEDIQLQRCHLTYSRSRAVKNQESKCRGVGFFSWIHCDGLPQTQFSHGVGKTW